MEMNYLEMEHLIKEQVTSEDDDPGKPESGYQYNFNKEGINNLINVHDHIEQLIKSKDKVDDLNRKNRKRKAGTGRTPVMIKENSQDYQTINSQATFGIQDAVGFESSRTPKANGPAVKVTSLERKR
jgi:hypothetical protein